MRRIFAILFPLLLPGVLSAQISTWQLGGSGGLAWSASDSVRIFIDFDSVPGVLRYLPGRRYSVLCTVLGL